MNSRDNHRLAANLCRILNKITFHFFYFFFSFFSYNLGVIFNLSNKFLQFHAWISDHKSSFTRINFSAEFNFLDGNQFQRIKIWNARILCNEFFRTKITRRYPLQHLSQPLYRCNFNFLAACNRGRQANFHGVALSPIVFRAPCSTDRSSEKFETGKPLIPANE